MPKRINPDYPEAKEKTYNPCDGNCYCPILDERDIVGDKHRLCGGTLNEEMKNRLLNTKKKNKKK